jgi:hypothetical protein
MGNQNADADAWFTYTSFLASSARASLEESVSVSGHRLAEAIRRLLPLVPELREDAFFREIDTLLERNLTKAYLKSPEDFAAFLDELLQRFAAEARVRNGLD